MFFSLLGKLESNRVLDTMAKEVVGINAPRIALTRTWDERLDVAESEIGNTILTFGGGGLLNLALTRLFEKAQSKTAPLLAQRWAVFGRSFSIYSAVFAMLWGMPFLRNAMTIRRTGSTKFTEIIGAEDVPSQRLPDRYKEEQRNLKKAKKVFGLGLAGVVAFTTASLLTIRGKVGLGPIKALFENNTLNKALILKGGSFKEFAGIPALLFWGAPGYGGWIDAARDPFEVKEQLLKFVNFAVAFLGPQAWIGNYYKKHFKALLPEGVEDSYQEIKKALNNSAFKGPQAQNLQKAFGLWKKRNLLGLAFAILMLGLIPQGINIILTGLRIQHKKQETLESIPPNRNTENAVYYFPTKSLPVKRTFEAWTLQNR